MMGISVDLDDFISSTQYFAASGKLSCNTGKSGENRSKQIRERKIILHNKRNNSVVDLKRRRTT